MKVLDMSLNSGRCEYLDLLDQEKFQNDKLINNIFNNFCPSSAQTLHKLTISEKYLTAFLT